MTTFSHELFQRLHHLFNLGLAADIVIVLIRICLIILVSYLIIKLIDRLIYRKIQARQKRLETSPRIATLTTLSQSIVRYLIYFIAVIMVLQELNIKTESLLASAGILGLVVGFGAQNLIKDVISGFFIMLENQYAVGDYVQLAQFSGYVTDVGLRSTWLTDFSGEVHVIPNGQIVSVTNRSKRNSRALVDVYISYEEDLDKVIQILKQVSQEVANEINYVKDGPTIQGITQFNELYMVIRVVAMTVPMKEFDLETELRARIKKAFDREGINMKHEPRTLWFLRKNNGTKTV
ncbi:MAG: mechanosensitive ion channel family protein [Chitinophagales bacterium]